MSANILKKSLFVLISAKKAVYLRQIFEE